MKILVTGSSGLIGSAVVRHLTGTGHFVVRLVRSEPSRERGDISWDPIAGRIERAKLEGMDAVVHLAGESIAGLWTKAKKQRIYSSRVTVTEFLCESLAGLRQRPRVLLCASATGYYGNRGDAWLDESAAPGRGFLADTCQDWERATELASRAGIRVVNMRTGVVLSPAGGMLRQLMPVFKTGLGGTIGMGRHYVSWIAIDDLVGAVQFALDKESLSGPINISSPQPVTNREFTSALAHTLRRPAFLPVPSPILALLPGGMGRELFLSSARVAPAKLEKSGFKFKYPQIEDALRHLTS